MFVCKYQRKIILLFTTPQIKDNHKYSNFIYLLQGTLVNGTLTRKKFEGKE